MERARGSILKGDGTVLENLDITIQHVTPARGSPSWSGSFYLTDPAAYIQAGGPYKLVLEDGRSSEIVVNQVIPTQRGGDHVRFHCNDSLA